MTAVSGSHDFAEVIAGRACLLADAAGAPRVLVDSSTVSMEVSSTIREHAATRGTGPVGSLDEWRRRFIAEGLDALGKVPRGPGRPRGISAATVAKIVRFTLNTVTKGRPTGAAAHWPGRCEPGQSEMRVA